jgi:hypothetical protein
MRKEKMDYNVSQISLVFRRVDNKKFTKWKMKETSTNALIVEK